MSQLSEESAPASLGCMANKTRSVRELTKLIENATEELVVVREAHRSHRNPPYSELRSGQPVEVWMTRCRAARGAREALEAREGELVRLLEKLTGELESTKPFGILFKAQRERGDR